MLEVPGSDTMVRVRLHRASFSYLEVGPPGNESEDLARIIGSTLAKHAKRRTPRWRADRTRALTPGTVLAALWLVAVLVVAPHLVVVVATAAGVAVLGWLSWKQLQRSDNLFPENDRVVIVHNDREEILKDRENANRDVKQRWLGAGIGLAVGLAVPLILAVLGVGPQ